MKTKLLTPSELQRELQRLGHAQMQELAVISSVPFTTLWKIRSGKTGNPRLMTVNKFYRLIPVAAAA